MSLISTFDITLISLSAALISILIAVVALLKSQAYLSRIKAVDKSIDAYALVQEFSNRSKNFERELIALKIRFEILELRLARKGENGPLGLVRQGEEIIRDYVTPSKLTRGRSNDDNSFGRLSSIPGDDVNLKQAGEGSSSKKDPIQFDILQAVSEGNGSVTARDIQMRIGRTREHVARMMKSLNEQGLIRRDDQVRPFTYSITESGRDKLG